MSADVYRYDVVDGVALFDLTEFDVGGGVLLERFFETVEAILARPEVHSAVFVVSEGGGISKWFFERFDVLASQIDEFDIRRVAFVGPPGKQVALRGRLRETNVVVETPETAEDAIEWARA
ncbi:hypothetical protein [Halogeometricum limi]|uniref:SpoIIAA-like n=1 Tax=Halogeometricum limi TaxID=555875 RepID=A0A1I6FQT8_9EURY|nr:hypothetical protein [Halogeometricum limi]SFR32286.1 hypothetical protein SAMN04488124_0094 [Halogeometricum limi]